MRGHTTRHLRTILTNAGSLGGTTFVTALLGFAFWALAARLFPPEVVGYGSATVSTMSLLATIGSVGIGTALIGEMSGRGRRGPIVAAALLASSGASALLAVGFVVVAGLIPQGVGVPQGFATAAVLVIGVVLTGAVMVLDVAFVGALRGTIQLRRNIVFSVVKLLLLYVVGTTAHGWGALGILVAWAAGILISVAWVAVLLGARGIPMLHRPALTAARRMRRTAVSHQWLNLALEAPHLVSPIVATVLVSPTDGAAFYAAWTMLSFLFILPFHLGTVLYATGSAEPAVVPEQLRFTLRMSAFAGVAGMPGLAVIGPLVLLLFGPVYHDLGTVPLLLLVLGYPPMVATAHFVALCRVRRRTSFAAVVLCAGATVELGAAALGAVSGGLLGLSIGILAGKWLQGLLVVRTVRATARSSALAAEVITPAPHATSSGERSPR